MFGLIIKNCDWLFTKNKSVNILDSVKHPHKIYTCIIANTVVLPNQNCEMATPSTSTNGMKSDTAHWMSINA